VGTGPPVRARGRQPRGGQATKAEACAFFDRTTRPRAILVVVGNIDPGALSRASAGASGPIAAHGRARRSSAIRSRPARLCTGPASKHVADVEHPTAVIYLPAPPWGDAGRGGHDATLAAAPRRAGRALDERTDWILDVDVGYGGDGYQRATLIVVEVEDAARLDDAVGAVLRAGRASGRRGPRRQRRRRRRSRRPRGRAARRVARRACRPRRSPPTIASPARATRSPTT
jgi:hypothetical protein